MKGESLFRSRLVNHQEAILMAKIVSLIGRVDSDGFSSIAHSVILSIERDHANHPMSILFTHVQKLS